MNDYIESRAQKAALKDLWVSVVIFFAALILSVEVFAQTIIGGYTQSGYDFTVQSNQATAHPDTVDSHDIIAYLLSIDPDFHELMLQDCLANCTQEECSTWFAQFGITLTFPEAQPASSTAPETLNVPLPAWTPLAMLTVFVGVTNYMKQIR